MMSIYLNELMHVFLKCGVRYVITVLFIIYIHIYML